MSYGALTAVILITREFLLHELGERGILHKQVKDGRQAKKSKISASRGTKKILFTQDLTKNGRNK